MTYPSRTPEARVEYRKNNAERIAEYMRNYNEKHAVELAEKKAVRRAEKLAAENEAERERRLVMKRKSDKNFRDRQIAQLGSSHPATHVKRVTIQYPDCAELDRMSKAEFGRWKPDAFPPGTRVWIDGQELPMQMILMEATK
jgi:hypothetical protein